MSQEFDNTELDLVKQKDFYPYEYMIDFEKTQEQLQSKEMFHGYLTGEKLVTKNKNMF